MAPREYLFAISGGDDITIHEIQEAAKIITESIDKDAKSNLRHNQR